jgi:hypothetical protein
MFCAKLHIVGQAHGAEASSGLQSVPPEPPDQPEVPRFASKGNKHSPPSISCLECRSMSSLAGTHYSRLTLLGVGIMLPYFTVSIPCTITKFVTCLCKLL